ncbi:hypothetical protein BC830DRAFT_857772 [Chytriomyces sp. MP71]|nr:hypothetical protein BC830DRAFT_857772 [Chytriomyces sp. MP71]
MSPRENFKEIDMTGTDPHVLTTNDQQPQIHDATARDEVGHEMASAPDVSNKVQDSAADTSSYSSEEAQKQNDQKSRELPEYPNDKKEGHGMFHLGTVTDTIKGATVKAGNAVGRAAAAAAEPINKVRGKSNASPEMAKKDLDNVNERI